MRTHPLYASLLLVLTACGSDVTSSPPVNPVVTASAASAWSGDTIFLHSTAFVGIDTLPLVLAGNETLSVGHAGDSVLVVLPDTNGPVTLTVMVNNGGHTGVDVRVYGFSGTHLGPDLAGAYAAPWTALGPTIGVAVKGGRLVSIDYAVDSVHILAGDTGLDNGWACTWVLPLPGVDNPRLVSTRLQNNCYQQPWVALAVNGDTAARDSGPAQAPFAIHLGRGRWLTGWWGNHPDADAAIWVRQQDGSFAEAKYFGCYKPRSAAVSRRFAVFTHCRNAISDSIPVFDTAGVAYRAGYYSSDGGSVFSADGDTLFQVEDQHILRVHGPTGAVARQTPMNLAFVTHSLALALDPAKPLLYMADDVGVVGNTSAGSIEVQVRDRSTLALLATLRGPPLSSASPGCDIYLDPATRRLYVVQWGFSGGPQEIQRFDLMP